MQRILSLIMLTLLSGCTEDVEPGKLSEVLTTYSNLERPIAVRPKQYTVLEKHIVITNDGQLHALKYLQLDRHFYLVIDADTFSSDMWGRTSIQLDDTVHVETLDLSLLTSSGEPLLLATHFSNGNLKALFQYEEGNYHYLACVDLKLIDLNADGIKEAVASYYRGWLNNYYIFSKTENRWKFHSYLESPSWGDPFPIVTNLSGYFGVAFDYHATCMSAGDYDYYRLNNDTIVYCFSVGSYFNENNSCVPERQYDLLMSSRGSGILNSSTSVTITYRVAYDLHPIDCTVPLFSYTNTYSLVYSQYDPDSAWRPDHLRKGFKVDGEYQAVFYPEIEMMYELCELKESGTARQKSYLKDLDCDIGFYR